MGAGVLTPPPSALTLTTEFGLVYITVSLFYDPPVVAYYCILVCFVHRVTVLCRKLHFQSWKTLSDADV